MQFCANANAGCFTNFTTRFALQGTHQDTLQIIFYQDAFELAIPLGQQKAILNFWVFTGRLAT